MNARFFYKQAFKEIAFKVKKSLRDANRAFSMNGNIRIYILSSSFFVNEFYSHT